MRTIYISQNIKYLRKQKKITQEELGKLVGVKKAAVSTYEIGRNYPSVESLLQIVELFQVNMEDFFFKDLSREKPSNRVEEPIVGYQDDFSRLMMSRIKELEREIKENAPNLARRLEL